MKNLSNSAKKKQREEKENNWKQCLQINLSLEELQPMILGVEADLESNLMKSSKRVMNMIKVILKTMKITKTNKRVKKLVKVNRK